MATPDVAGVLPLQDFIVIGGNKSPGRCVVRNLRTPREWEVRKGWGMSGASTVFMGNAPATFDVDIYIWDPIQWADWLVFENLYLKKSLPFVKPLALGIKHPVLEDRGVTQVVVTDVTGWEESDETGEWKCTISFLEWKRPMPALGKPLAAIPAASKPAPTAQDAADVAIAAKLETLKGLASVP